MGKKLGKHPKRLWHLCRARGLGLLHLENEFHHNLYCTLKRYVLLVREVLHLENELTALTLTKTVKYANLSTGFRTLKFIKNLIERG